MRSHSRSLSQGSRHARTGNLRARKIRAACALGAGAVLCAVLAGCAVVTNTAAGAPSSSGPQTPVAPKYATVTNFGASITCGYYATPQGASGNIYSTLGYAGVFDSSLSGTTAQNLCRAGDMAADTARAWVMPNAVPALGRRQLYTLMVGTNDLLQCGGQTGCLPNFINAMTAMLSWLALPANDKVLGSSLNVSSAWTPDLNIGVATNTAGASLSFPVQQTVDGRTLYIAYRVFDAGKVNGGTATVQVDGKTVATLSTIANAGRFISTPNGTSDTIWAVGIPLGAVGAHTVTITNGSSGGFFSFQWAGVSSGQYASTTGAPRVMVALLPQSTAPYFNTVEVTHNNALNQLATALAADGMWVTVVHCDSVLNITTDLVDTVHPNTAGHAKLAAAFEGVL
ncbi:MAG TPA: hypothetical protein VGU25_01755 [Acidobacteriaceae bacterium]|nr:hypothetical protein [Acidobacteriaceae bacterium]